jgi:RHH-type rel operon transcriptional repressor/antitoxin RelB
MPISVRLGKDIEARLEQLAKLTGRTKTYYIRQAVIEKLEDLEDLYMAEQVLENPGKRYTSSEVRQELGLDD